ASSLNNLAELYRSQGRNEQAEPLHLQALEIQKNIFGWHHPNTIVMLQNIVLVYINQDKKEEALAFLKIAFEIYKQESESQNPNQAVIEPLVELFKYLQIPPFA
ncbi:MAG: tetratricopeptide repeat protein, partial [Blastocatellia bacterium]|nr:tetratricopeptide repeat protein [Blastocatellia bacterium]